MGWVGGLFAGPPPLGPLRPTSAPSASALPEPLLRLLPVLGWANRVPEGVVRQLSLS